MNPPDPRQERYNQLLTRIRHKVEELKNNNRTLAEENRSLRLKLEKNREEAEDTFSALGESERMALRHQIDGLIAKLDKHLEE